jgi:hypothetical protein
MALPIIPSLRATLWPGGFGVMVPPPFAFDAVRSEQHGVAFAVAAQPLEDSTIVTDHVQEQPEVVTFEGVLTDYPGLPTAPTDPVGPDRYITQYRQLVALARLRLPMDFSCSVTIYRSMVIERIAAPRTGETGKSLVCTITLRKVEIATVDEAQVLADAALAVALGEQDLGEVAFEQAL